MLFAIRCPERAWHGQVPIHEYKPILFAITQPPTNRPRSYFWVFEPRREQAFNHRDELDNPVTSGSSCADAASLWKSRRSVADVADHDHVPSDVRRTQNQKNTRNDLFDILRLEPDIDNSWRRDFALLENQLAKVPVTREQKAFIVGGMCKNLFIRCSRPEHMDRTDNIVAF